MRQPAAHCVTAGLNTVSGSPAASAVSRGGRIATDCYFTTSSQPRPVWEVSPGSPGSVGLTGRKWSDPSKEINRLAVATATISMERLFLKVSLQDYSNVDFDVRRRSILSGSSRVDVQV